jgi:hypothetical protein
VLVPRDALVILRSVDGTLQAQGLTGDLIMEASSGAVGVTGLVNAHIRVRTLSGPINLTDIREGHLDVLSVSGNVKLQSVVGSLDRRSRCIRRAVGLATRAIQARRENTCSLPTRGTSSSQSLPAPDIKARSAKGESDKGFPSGPASPGAAQGNRLLRRGIVSTSALYCVHSPARSGSSDPDALRSYWRSPLVSARHIQASRQNIQRLREGRLLPGYTVSM